MFFNEKNNTNIDNEFNNKSFSDKFNLFKYKNWIIIGMVVIILLIIMLVIFTNRKTDGNLILNGEEIITIYQGDDYIEPGYNAYNSKDEDLTSQVVIESDLNKDVVGEYEVLYILGDITKTRYIKVVDKPENYTFIYLNSVNNTVDVYLQKGDKYIEPGYQVYSTSGTDLTSKVKVSGKVDTSKKGIYKLTYSVVDLSGVTISVSRKVIVMDSNISLSLGNEEYTNQDVTINAYVIDEYFDYMILPDNTKVTTNKYAYKVNSNGKYTFKVYNKKGSSKESSIEVKTIDKTGPSGSCSGSYEDGKSTIIVSAKDNIGISKYVINNKSYTSNKITINSELKSVNVTIYDKAGNSKNISCTLDNKTGDNSSTDNNSGNDTPTTSDKSITFSYEYNSEGKYMSHALYTPSSASSNKKTPLIIWLHGGGGAGHDESILKSSAMLSVIDNGTVNGFDAYVLCPQLRGGYWNNSSAKDKLNLLVDKIVKDYNIDTSRISIVGESLGAIGAQYMVYYRQNYYSSLVVFSGYHPLVDIAKIKDVPTKGFVGTPSKGEDMDSYNYMLGMFVQNFGDSTLTILKVGHGVVGKTAFELDDNNDGKSDLIEWMLSQ